MDRDQILGLLERVGHQEDGEIDIADTALLLGVLDAPEMELAPARHHLDQIRNDMVEAARVAGSIEQALAALRLVIYDRHRYRGGDVAYDDLRNANLLHVIDRKKGLPVALGILCIHAAGSVGWDMTGLNFPSHFLLRLEIPPERAVIDPFDGCAKLDAAAARTRLKELLGDRAEIDPSYFAPVGNRAILLRLQNNIKLRALQNKDVEKALDVLTGMSLIAPQEGALIGESAILYAQRGELRRAIDTLTGFLDRGDTRDAEDYPKLEAMLCDLRSNLN